MLFKVVFALAIVVMTVTTCNMLSASADTQRRIVDNLISTDFRHIVVFRSVCRSLYRVSDDQMRWFVHRRLCELVQCARPIQASLCLIKVMNGWSGACAMLDALRTGCRQGVVAGETALFVEILQRAKSADEMPRWKPSHVTCWIDHMEVAEATTKEIKASIWFKTSSVTELVHPDLTQRAYKISSPSQTRITETNMHSVCFRTVCQYMAEKLLPVTFQTAASLFNSQRCKCVDSTQMLMCARCMHWQMDGSEECNYVLRWPVNSPASVFDIDLLCVQIDQLYDNNKLNIRRLHGDSASPIVRLRQHALFYYDHSECSMILRYDDRNEQTPQFKNRLAKYAERGWNQLQIPMSATMQYKDTNIFLCTPTWWVDKVKSWKIHESVTSVSRY